MKSKWGTRKELLETMADDYGMSVMEMLKQATYDSVAISICVKCLYTTEMEPDQREGWCEECEENTVQSCLVLAEMI